MKEVLETLILNLVDKKDEVSVEEILENDTAVYKVKVANDEMGKVIGKQGRVAKSIRILIRALAGKEQKKVNIEFVEE